MSVTGEDIVAAHGHIACGIRQPRTAGNSVPAETPDSLFRYCLATGRILMVYKSRTQTGRGAF